MKNWKVTLYIEAENGLVATDIVRIVKTAMEESSQVVCVSASASVERN